MKEKMLVSLDGAVESLVTTWLLKKQGFQLRGVFFDISDSAENKEEVRKQVSDFEKKLGIPVQLVECGQEAREVVFKEIEFGIARGFRYDIKSLFHQKFLFPKLFALKEQYQFQKIATGHRVNLYYEPLEDQMKVLRFHTASLDESDLLVGLSQEQLRSLMFPLGAIPSTMIQKLASELDLINNFKPMKFEMHYATEVKDKPIYSTDGSYVGMTSEDSKLGLGMSYENSVIFEMNSSQNQVVIGSMNERVIKEIWLENASWFSGEDLGFKLKSCQMSWKSGLGLVPIQLMQFEGGGLKALLNQPVSGDNANIFNGDTVLWSEGETVLGGARVIRCL